MSELYCLHCGFEAEEREYRDVIHLDGDPIGIQWQCPECRVWSEKIWEVLGSKKYPAANGGIPA